MNDEQMTTASSESYDWVSLYIPAMDCPEEFRLIDKGLRNQPGLVDVQPNYLERSVRVQFRSSDTGIAAIRRRLDQIGFPARDLTEENSFSSAHHWRSVCVAVGIGLLLISIILYLVGIHVRIYAVFAIVATCAAGAPVAIAAWRSLALMRLDMNVLMIVASLGALAIGEWFEAATAMTLFGVAHWLESLSLRRASQAIAGLADRLPQLAHLVGRSAATCSHDHTVHDQHKTVSRGEASPEHEFTDVPVHTLRAGDFVMVRPGEHIPIDGEISEGNSLITEAALTGESVPVARTVGDRVLAGTVNGEGALRVLATASADESAMSQVGRLVQTASTNRSRAERFVDRFARYYTPVVIGLALFVAAVVPLVLSVTTTSDWSTLAPDWFHSGLVLLVVACPCALVISTPITMVCGLQRAASHGLLVKGAESLEMAADISVVAIDKTGTLTVGKPAVEHVEPADGESRKSVLALAAAVERQSAHPIAKAITQAAIAEDCESFPADGVMAMPGRGISARLGGLEIRLGTYEFATESLAPAARAVAASLEADPSTNVTCVYVASDRLLGRIELADLIRDDAVEAIIDLREVGIEQTVMLTGDRRAVATEVAKQLGLDDAQPELLPADKVDRVADLRSDGRRVAMVGDGFNDAPALATADLGIAMGSGASSLALESADVVVLSPKLASLGRLFRLAQRTRARLWQNIFIALAIKALVLLLTVAGYGTMWLAVAADVGASLLVIFNSMRLLSETAIVPRRSVGVKE